MDSPALTKLSDTELDDFILNYERMVKRVSDFAVWLRCI